MLSAGLIPPDTLMYGALVDQDINLGLAQVSEHTCDILHPSGQSSMQRKTAADYPQELLELFDLYVHGDIPRREFLDGAKKFAVGGVTATAILESLAPNYAWAEQVPKD